MLKIIAETIPLENVDPTCVHADTPDTLNDIFMYRLLDRQLASTSSHASNSTQTDSSPVVVFKCSNNEAKALVDSIRTANGKPLKHLKRFVNHQEFHLVLSRFFFGFSAQLLINFTEEIFTKQRHSIRHKSIVRYLF